MRMNTGSMIWVKVCGIPCFMEVKALVIERSTWDYPGYSEFDFELYDRKGYRAKWLERKIENNSEEQAGLFEAALDDAMSDSQYD